MTETTERETRDALWTYVGQDTWLLQIAPMRYLIRSTYRHSTYGGAGVALICIDNSHNIHEFLHLTSDDHR
jgi:hypothetical protein